MFSFWSKAWNIQEKNTFANKEVVTLKFLPFHGLERQSPLWITPVLTFISTCQCLKLETNGRQASPADRNCLSNREAISKATKIGAMNSSCNFLCKLLARKLQFPKSKLRWFDLLNAFLSQIQGCTLTHRKWSTLYTLYIEIRPKCHITWSWF